MFAIKSGLLLMSMISIVLAGSLCTQNQEVKLDGGRFNTVNFACGSHPQSGPNGNDHYIYTYSGQPSWLKVRGNQLYGTAPGNERGPWYVTVNYQSVQDPARKGSVVLALTLKEVRAPSSGIGATVQPQKPKSTALPAYPSYPTKPKASSAASPVTYKTPSPDHKYDKSYQTPSVLGKSTASEPTKLTTAPAPATAPSSNLRSSPSSTATPSTSLTFNDKHITRKTAPTTFVYGPPGSPSYTITRVVRTMTTTPEPLTKPSDSKKKPEEEWNTQQKPATKV